MQTMVYQKECTSTNDEILFFLQEKTLEPIALYTFNQTKGRGQYGNIWESDKDLNIAFTFAVRACNIKISTISFNYHTATVIREFLANLTQNKVEIKWPNDMIINGKKVCGFIIEQRKYNGIDYFLIGIGINVLQENFDSLPKAGSILTQTSLALDLHKTARQLFDFLKTKIENSSSEDQILNDFNEYLFKKGKVATFQKDKIRQNGIIQHADAHGYLHIALEQDGIKKFLYKEIAMLY